MLASLAEAQSNYAVLRGSVLDPQRRPIPGAQIHAVSQRTGATSPGREIQLSARLSFQGSGRVKTSLWPGLLVPRASIRRSGEPLNLLQLALLHRRLPSSLGQRDYPVNSGNGKVLHFAAGPVDLNVIDLGRLSQSEVRARIAG